MKHGSQCGQPVSFHTSQAVEETWRAIIASAAALVWSAGCQADFCGDLGQVLAAADTAFSSLKSEDHACRQEHGLHRHAPLFGDVMSHSSADGKASYYCSRRVPSRRILNS